MARRELALAVRATHQCPQYDDPAAQEMGGTTYCPTELIDPFGSLLRIFERNVEL